MKNDKLFISIKLQIVVTVNDTLENSVFFSWNMKIQMQLQKRKAS